MVRFLKFVFIAFVIFNIQSCSSSSSSSSETTEVEVSDEDAVIPAMEAILSSMIEANPTGSVSETNNSESITRSDPAYLNCLFSDTGNNASTLSQAGRPGTYGPESDSVTVDSEDFCDNDGPWTYYTLTPFNQMSVSCSGRKIISISVGYGIFYTTASSTEFFGFFQLGFVNLFGMNCHIFLSEDGADDITCQNPETGISIVANANSCEPTVIDARERDYDSDGMSDYFESINEYKNLVNSNGTITIARYNLFSLDNIPTALTGDESPLNVYGSDATADYDGDGVDNGTEEESGTNLQVATSTADFTSKTEIEGPILIQEVTTGDLDDDGNLDLVSVGLGTDLVSVRMGNGDGTFEDAVTYATGSTPSAVLLADLNRDFLLDIAVANSGSDTVSVLDGNGDGTFDAKVDYDVGDYPVALAVGDFDGDLLLDLAVANRGSANEGTTVSLLLHDETTDDLEVADTTLTTNEGPNSIVVGDFDGDYKLDLAVTNFGSNDGTTFTVFTGNGDGTFDDGADYAVNTAPWGITTGDFNSDRYLDLAVTSQHDDTVTVYLNDQDGTFTENDSYVTGTVPADVITFDADGDGNLDLVAANYGESEGLSLSYFAGNGDGTFADGSNIVAGSSPQFLVPGDFDNDHDIDMVSSNFADGSLSIYLNE